MPHVREVRATSHDDHDLMLVAALAAGDLAGTDRDRAIDLTDSCGECATLRDDLRAIARTTADLRPPARMPDRDFRLSPQQAARLRPAGWRRFLPTGVPGFAFARPLGVTLATFGLVGLLIGNAPLGFLGGQVTTVLSKVGSSISSDAGQAAPAAAPEASSERSVDMAGASAAASGLPEPAASLAGAPSAAGASTGGDESGTGLGPAASSGSASGDGAYAAGGGKTSVAGLPVAGASAPTSASGVGATAVAPSVPGPLTAPNLLFIVAIVIGLVLVVASRRLGRRPA